MADDALYLDGGDSGHDFFYEYENNLIEHLNELIKDKGNEFNFSGASIAACFIEECAVYVPYMRENAIHLQAWVRDILLPMFTNIVKNYETNYLKYIRSHEDDDHRSLDMTVLNGRYHQLLRYLKDFARLADDYEKETGEEID